MHLVAVVSSPLERCQQTAQHILDRQTGTPSAPVDPDLTECDYGQWQGRTLHAGQALQHRRVRPVDEELSCVLFWTYDQDARPN